MNSPELDFGLMPAAEFAMCKDIAELVNLRIDKKIQANFANGKMKKESIAAYMALIFGCSMQEFINSVAPAFKNYDELITFRKAFFNEINFYMTTFGQVSASNPEIQPYGTNDNKIITN